MRCSGSSAALTADEEFLELLCAEEDLLRAKFDAMIAAEWPAHHQTLPAIITSRTRLVLPCRRVSTPTTSD